MSLPLDPRTRMPLTSLVLLLPLDPSPMMSLVLLLVPRMPPTTMSVVLRLPSALWMCQRPPLLEPCRMSLLALVPPPPLSPLSLEPRTLLRERCRLGGEMVRLLACFGAVGGQ